jgi:hypothetical protein
MNNLESLLKELGCKTPVGKISSDQRDIITGFLKMENEYRRQYNTDFHGQEIPLKSGSRCA